MTDTPLSPQPVRLSCHCGAVVLQVALTDGLNTVRRCDCSFCRRRGAAAVSAPLDGIEILQGHEALRLYQWGTKTAKHYFCGICGIYTHPPRRSNPNQYGVNLGAIDGVNPAEMSSPWVDGVNHPSDAK